MNYLDARRDATKYVEISNDNSQLARLLSAGRNQTPREVIIENSDYARYHVPPDEIIYMLKRRLRLNKRKLRRLRKKHGWERRGTRAE